MLTLVLLGCLVAASAAAPQQAQKEPVAIIAQESDASPDGTYHYSFESADGTKAAQDGQVKLSGPENQPGESIKGSFQYQDNDGNTIITTYTADENGYQAQGAHLPVAPEIPPAIQRALQYIAEHPPPPEPKN